ncbi:MAG: hypothetical protein U9Q97_08670, partial [Acidobacteriota bacterium]|nr:hypothetical protein [Acidobacteriota bacterium]
MKNKYKERKTMLSPISGPLYPARVGSQLHNKKRDILTLSKNWQLKIDPKSIGAREGWYASEWKFSLPVQVPDCIQSHKELGDNYPSSEGYPNSYLGTAWYKSCSIIPETWAEEKVWLKFGGIMPAAHIWMNERYLGYHSYSPVAVKWDVSNSIKLGELNCVTVEIVESDLGFAGGMRGYKGWSGLYRPVEIEHTNKIWIDDDIYVKPDFTNSQAILKVKIHNDFPYICSIAVDASVYPLVKGSPISNVQNNIKISENAEATVYLKVPIPNFHPWFPDDPFLYLVKVRLFDGNREVDVLSERFGMRELRVKGNRLELNREPFILRAWGEEYFSTNISPILDQNLLKRRIMAAKQMGFNGVRYHTHIAPPEELNLCDELGLLVHDEISVISNFNKTEPYP